MTCITEDAPMGALEFRRPGFLYKLSLVFRRKKRDRVPRLDPRALSDYMKRDLGFLDGRG